MQPRIIRLPIRQVTVTTSPSQILETNPKRKAVFIYNNDADSNVETFTNKDGAYGKGMLIPWGGGYYMGDGLPQDGLWAIAEADTIDVRIEEFVEE